MARWNPKRVAFRVAHHPRSAASYLDGRVERNFPAKDGLSHFRRLAQYPSRAFEMTDAESPGFDVLPRIAVASLRLITWESHRQRHRALCFGSFDVLVWLFLWD